jgi:hypothetical protein
MSGAPNPHPAPHADKLSTRRAFFMLFGGPIAWFVQLCGSVWLLGWPCYPMMDRYAQPMPNYGWTRAGAGGLLAICLMVALAAGLVSLAKLREVKDEKAGDHTDLIEVGHGRTRFTAMWGVILGFGFAIASILTIVPFLTVSRCVG